MLKLGYLANPVNEDKSLKGLVEAVRKVGLQHIELAIGYADYHTLTPQDAEQIRQSLAAENVSIDAYCKGSWGWSDDHEQVEQEKAFAFAKALGAKVIVGCTRSTFLPETDRLCNAYDMNYAIEPHWNHAEFRTPWDVLRERRHYSLRVGANIDTGHYASVNVDAVWALRFLYTRFHHVHLKDIALYGAHTMVPLGTGRLNLEPFLRELAAVKFDELVSIETESSLEAVIRSKEYCERILRTMAEEEKKAGAKT